MTFNFPLILVYLTAGCGLIYLLDVLFLARWRAASGKAMPMWIDYGRSFFSVFLIVLLIRSFVAQPYRVPSGSLEPTVQPGDFLFVDQFSYGLRLPVLHTKIWNVGEPKRGDIAVFRFPGNTRIDYVKRVIGLPGDRIVYKNKTLYINGQKCPQTFLSDSIWIEPTGRQMVGPFEVPVQVLEEDLLGMKHHIQVVPEAPSNGNYDVVVPEGNYFMMGDNRDGSADSRYWGFVPEKDLVGKVRFIWMNWDSVAHTVHWSRIGTRL